MTSSAVEIINNVFVYITSTPLWALVVKSSQICDVCIGFVFCFFKFGIWHVLETSLTAPLAHFEFSLHFPAVLYNIILWSIVFPQGAGRKSSKNVGSKQLMDIRVLR